jgi:hypothetical protein
MRMGASVTKRLGSWPLAGDGLLVTGLVAAEEAMV